MLGRCEVLLCEGTQLAVGPMHAAAERAHVDLHDLRSTHLVGVWVIVRGRVRVRVRVSVRVGVARLPRRSPRRCCAA